MKITKYEHSGVVVEKDGKVLVFDPVEFEEKLPVFDNVAGIIISHQHNDHLQPAVIARILSQNPNAKIYTTEDAHDLIPDSNIVKDGTSVNIAGFKLSFFGKDHASIFPGQSLCGNIGTIIDDLVVHPGDSFDVPNITTKVLLTPIAAPWCRISEVVDYIKRVNPEMVIPIHDAVLSSLGKGFSYNIVNNACHDASISFSLLKTGEYLEI